MNTDHDRPADGDQSLELLLREEGRRWRVAAPPPPSLEGAVARLDLVVAPPRPRTPVARSERISLRERRRGSGRLLLVAAVVVLLVAGVVGLARQLAPQRMAGPADGPDAGALPPTHTFGVTTTTLLGSSPLPPVVVASKQSTGLTVRMPSFRGTDDCHPGEVPVVTRSDTTTVTVTVGVYGLARASDGPYACPDYAVSPSPVVVPLDGPLGDRAVVDGSTGQPVPVVDRSTTAYPEAALDPPYHLVSITSAASDPDGPTVTWRWEGLPPQTITLRPATTTTPAPGDTVLDPVDVEGRRVTLLHPGGDRHTLVLLWAEDATHVWRLARSSTDDTGDYGDLVLELVRTFRPATG